MKGSFSASGFQPVEIFHFDSNDIIVPTYLYRLSVKKSKIRLLYH
jgi:hypothetical protein